MIKFVRIISFVIAIVITIFSIFYIEPDQELVKAQKAYRNGDMDQALRMARRANHAFSENNKKVNAFYLQAKAASKMEWKDTAVDYLDQLLSIDQENALALMFRGELQYQLNQNQNALIDLDKGLDLVSQDISKHTLSYYHVQRGLTYLALGQANHAEDDALEALHLSTDLAEAHDLMSKVFEEKGDIEGALAECEKSYQLSIEKNKLSFMTPKGEELSKRLVDLKVKYLRSSRKD
ncbi:tetratricopeptide repeat protein [Sunxiuqinia sp. A32]|uniref:tetratricopeptide repeat protein n=1 Tax=Sunxiuqinia sp. A32 TaxID=3461496 RepID=UPI004046095D